MSFYFASEQNRRSANEDSYCQIDFRMNHEALLSVMAVADGMGGLSNGKMYSSKAIELWYEALLKVILSEKFKEQTLEKQILVLQEFSGQIYDEINQELYHMGLDRGMKGGTTLTCAIHFWDSWIISNCGDSPAYSVKDGEATLQSCIQNKAWQMIRDGETTLGSASFYQYKNRLLEYLGRRESVHPHIKTVSDAEVDYMVLGTDGALGENAGRTLVEILSFEEIDGQDMLKKLFEEARSLGEEDNQTAILYMKDFPKEQSGTKKILKSAWMIPDVSREDMESENCTFHEVKTRTMGRRLLDRFKAGHKQET